MTEPYGTIIVCGDYEGNTEAIANALNSLGLNSDGVKFSANEEHVALENYHVPCPTVFPERDVIRFDDGRKYFFDEADKSVIEEWEKGNCGLEGEPITLETISDLISPFLTKGTIELVAVGYTWAVYEERLVIRCDGYVERYTNYCEAPCPSEFCEDLLNVEYYRPSTKKRAA
jgi:hypothetical protein